MARSLRLYGGAVSFLGCGCLWPIILLLPSFGPTQGPSWCILQSRWFPARGFLGRLARHLMDWCLLRFLALPGFSLGLVVGPSLVLCSFEASRGGRLKQRCYGAPPRQAVLVDGSLTTSYVID